MPEHPLRRHFGRFDRTAQQFPPISLSSNTTPFAAAIEQAINDGLAGWHDAELGEQLDDPHVLTLARRASSPSPRGRPPRTPAEVRQRTSPVSSSRIFPACRWRSSPSVEQSLCVRVRCSRALEADRKMQENPQRIGHLGSRRRSGVEALAGFGVWAGTLVRLGARGEET